MDTRNQSTKRAGMRWPQEQLELGLSLENSGWPLLGHMTNHKPASMARERKLLPAPPEHMPTLLAWREEF